jgi:phospholipid/cholesterol/gamma-HCH transport system substrate-binding protein
MEKDARYFTVGVFVTLALLMLVGFSIWVAGVHDLSGHQRYTIYFTDPVSGLDQQAVVKYKGVEVGKILRLRLTPERHDLVKVDVEVRAETPVRDRTTATIAAQGITGVNYIDLDTPNGDDNPPASVEGEKYPVLKGEGSRIAKLLDDLPKLMNEFQTALSTVNDFGKEGAKMADAVRNLSDRLNSELPQLSNQFQMTLSAVDDLSKEGAKTADSVRGLADKLKDNPSQIITPPSRKGVEIPK